MAKKVGYFIAGIAPTVAEQADIAWLNAHNAAAYVPAVRCLVGNSQYSGPDNVGGGTIEVFDLCASGNANANIPAAYNGVGTLTIPQGGDAIPGDILVIGPNPLSFVHTSVSQMTALLVHPDSTATDATANASMVWTSGTPANMTIGAATGRITGVLAGTSLITATLTTSGKTLVATQTVTCS